MKTARDQAAAWKKAKRALDIMMAAAMVRVLHTVHGVSVDYVYLRLRQDKGFTPDMIDEVAALIDERGGPLMSEQEIQGAIFSAIAAKQHLEAAAV